MVTQTQVHSEVEVPAFGNKTIVISTLIAGNLMVLAVLALIYMTL